MPTKPANLKRATVVFKHSHIGLIERVVSAPDKLGAITLAVAKLKGENVIGPENEKGLECVMVELRDYQWEEGQ